MSDRRRTIARDDTIRRHLIQVARVVRLVVGDLDAPHCVASLAAEAAMSPFHFLRVFRALACETPEAFVRRLRLQRAAWMLVSGDDTILSIALAAHFESPEGFARAFRRLYGATPALFRTVRGDPWAPFSRHIASYRPPPSVRRGASLGGPVQIELRPMPPLLFAAVRSVGPYNTVGPAFQRVVGWAMRSGLMTPDTRVIGLSYDDPERNPADTLRYDAAVTLAQPVATPPDVRVGVLPACTWAIGRHHGPYSGMTESFRALFRALEGRPKLLKAWLPCIEIYLNDPQNTPADALLTEIGAPVVEWT